MNCPNCQSLLSCGCQKRTASNGRTVCQNCITSYETHLKQEAQARQQAENERQLKLASMMAAVKSNNQ